MTTNRNKHNRVSGESGNVLFLILIAVALFAALSYAVTQSTRSGAGNTSSETNLINSAQLTQYPAGVRTSVVRMIINGVAVDELRFNDPSDFGTANFDTPAERKLAVFHPNGGNATYQVPPQDVLGTVTGQGGKWHFNGNVQIKNIGLTNGTGGTGNDIIAWLPDVSSGVCKRMNQELGLGEEIPSVSGIDAGEYEEDMDHDYDFPDSDGPVIEGPDGEFIGQPFGCFEAADDNDRLIYYHVLVER